MTGLAWCLLGGGSSAWAQALTFVQTTTVFNGTTNGVNGLAAAIRNNAGSNAVFIAWEEKETGALPWPSTLKVNGFQCSAASCAPPTPLTPFGGGVTVGSAVRGQTQFALPSMAIQTLAGPPQGVELKLTRRERADVTLDCDGDLVSYLGESAGEDVEHLDLTAYSVTAAAGVTFLGALESNAAAPCVDRGSSTLRSRHNKSLACWTRRVTGDDEVHCWVGGEAVEVLAPVDVAPLGDAIEDHPSVDALSTTLPLARLVAVHNQDDDTDDALLNTKDRIAIHLPDADVSFRLGSLEADYPYVLLQPGLATMHLTFHAGGAARKVVQAVCDVSTGCDALADWTELLVIAPVVGADFEHAQIAVDGLFQVVSFQGTDPSDGQVKVWLKTRCAPATFPADLGGWGTVETVVDEPAAMRDQFVGERGNPYLVLNAQQNLVHVVYGESDNPSILTSDADVLWSTWSYTECP